MLADLLEISIHALREEGDLSLCYNGVATPTISIHALREEGDSTRPGFPGLLSISIHALREEGDPEWCPPPALPS